MLSHLQAKDTGRRIYYEPDELIDRLRVLLANATARLGEHGMTAVLGADLIDDLRRGEREICARLEDEFTIVVIGDFKRGKSTLINALLGESLVVTNATPETLVITELRQGPAFRAEVCLTNGGRYALERPELSNDRLAPILAKLGDQVDRVEIRAPNPALDHLCLVDTPGTGDLFKRFDARVANYLREADLVLVLVSPVSPLSASESAFLRSAVVPQDFSKVLCVLNMIDLVRDPSELERLVTLLQRRLLDLLPTAELFPVSALDELQRRAGGTPSNLALGELPARGFNAFRTALTEASATSHNTIQLDRAGHLLTELLDQLERRIEEIQAMLAIDHQQMERAIKSAEQDAAAIESCSGDRQRAIRETVTRLATETAGWMQGFIDRIEREVVPQLAGQPTEMVQRHLALFLIDCLRQSFDACLRVHEPVLNSLPATAALSNDEPVTLQPSVEASAWMPALRPTITKGIGLLSLLDGLGGGFQLSLVVLGNLVGVAERGVVKADYLQQLLAVLPGLRHAVAETVERSYQSLADHLIADFNNRSTAERESVLAALYQARSLHADRGSDQAETNALLARAREISAEARAALTELLEQLREVERG